MPIIGILNKFDFDVIYFIEFFQSKYNLRIVYLSFLQAFLSSIISCTLAIPFALSLFRQKKSIINKFFISLSGYSFVLPPILVVYSVIGIYGSNGFLNKYTNFYNLFEIKSLFGLKAILIAHILLNCPFATRIFFQNLNSMPKNYIDVAKSMNFNFLQNFFNLEWPLIKQNFFTVFSIVFILCFLSFAIVMTLGGSPKYSTLEVAIYQSVFFELNFNKAIILSFIQIIICLTFMIIGFFNLKGSNYFDIETENFDYLFSKNKYIIFCDYFIILIFSFFLFSPIFYILINFIENIFNTKYYLNYYFIKAFINSLFLCLTTGIIVTFFGLLICLTLIHSRKNILQQQILFIFSSIIIIVSPIIISLGYFIILGEFRYINLINYCIVILINCIFLIPFSILILFTRLKNIFLNFNDIKESYQIDEKKFILIIFPLIKKNILFVFSFSTALSFGDFTIISFFKSESFQTLPILLFKLITSYKFNEASFVAGFILLFSLFIYLLFDNKFYKDKPDNNI